MEQAVSIEKCRCVQSCDLPADEGGLCSACKLDNALGGSCGLPATPATIAPEPEYVENSSEKVLDVVFKSASDLV
jgi:hypothetical protein